MPIIVDLPSANGQDYDGLVVDVIAWLDRDDLADRIPSFIRNAEARFRRILTNTERETQITFDAAISTALPGDFGAIRSLVLTGALVNTFRVPLPLTQLSPADFQGKGGDFTDIPRYFAILAGNIVLWPNPDDTYTATLTYMADIPAIGPGNQTNWLLEANPDLYLYATLLQAEFFGWNDDRLPLIKGAVDETLSEIELAGRRKRYGSAPLAARPAFDERATNYGWR